VRHLFGVLGFIPLILSCVSEEQSQEKSETWRTLFNGKDLDGWIVRISGHDLDDNYGNTFRVEDGILKISYDQYGEFGRQFGSLFFNEKFSNYRLRVEYRFVGEQATGAPDWGFRDSGIQLHCQSPGSMRPEQEFPVCVELNLHGGDGTGDRPTGNVCTPGTHIILNGELFKQHCASTSTQTLHGDEWVTVEAEVRGSESIRHFVNGEMVVEYSQPQLDEASEDAQHLLAAGADSVVGGGYISLQSNSHPIEFRKIEILLLDR
jgi:hypothetical protein